jgi:hypothetical protein
LGRLVKIADLDQMRYYKTDMVGASAARRA